MSLFLDVLIIVVMVVTVVGGYKRGFIKSVMHFASSILAFFAAVFFTPYLSVFLCDNVFMSGISKGIAETLRSLLAVGGNALSTEQLFTDMPDALAAIIDRFNVDLDAFKEAFSSSELATEATVAEMSDFIARPIADAISSVVAFLVIFVAVLIVLRIVTAVIGVVFELPVLKQLNSLLGLVFGLLCAVLYAMVWSTLAVALVDALHSIDPVSFSEELIDGTVIVKLFSGIRMTLMVEILG